MADRTVKVSLVAATANYVAGMKQAEDATSKTSTAAQKLAAQREAMEKVGTTLLIAGGAIAAGLALAVKAASDFDAQMAQLQTLSHATAGEMDKLRNAALTSGQAIGFSATQVADAEIELTKAGVSVKDQLGGALTGALNLAAAGQLNVADATSIAASAMVQFGLKGKDVPHIADLLAAGADKALGSVSDLGNALKYVGPVAKGLGVSIEQTTGTLALFAQNGIIGEQAGTELRGTLLSLVAPSQQASDVMKKYGINLYDAQGKFVGVDGAAQQLKKGLGPLDEATRNQALGQIFGNAQITAAQILYRGGAKAVDEWTDKVNDAGFAQQQAAGKLDSLNGDLSKLKAAFQTSLIETGESASTSLRGVVQGITDIITAYNNMNDTGKTAVFIFGSVVAGAALLGGTFLTVVPKIVAFRDAILTLQAAGFSAKGALSSVGSFLLGPWGLALGAAALVAGTFIAKQVQMSQNTAALKNTLDSTTGAITKNTTATIANNLAAKSSFFGIDLGPSVYDQAQKIGLSIGTVTKAAEGNTSALKQLKSVQDAINSGSGYADKLGISQLDAKAGIDAVTKSVKDQNGSLTEAQKQVKQASKALADSSSSSDSASTSLDGVTSSASDAATAVDDVTNAIKGFNSPALDAASAAVAYNQAISDAADGVKNNTGAIDAATHSFNLNTQAGRDAESQTNNIAQTALSYAAALYQQTGSQDQATQALESGRDSLIKALGQYGVTGQAAQDYADKIIGTPTQWATLFTNNAADAKSKADQVNTAIHTIPQQYFAAINVQTNGIQQVDATTAAVDRLKSAIQQAASVGAASPIVAHATAGSVPYATGGAVYGPGTSTSDSIPARLSAGEHVLTARDVRNLGGQGAVYALRAAASRSNGRGAFAEGGQVQYAAPVQRVTAADGGNVGTTRNNTFVLQSLDPEAFAQAVIRRENLGFV